jgi:hypothetical protein
MEKTFLLFVPIRAIRGFSSRRGWEIEEAPDVHPGLRVGSASIRSDAIGEL